MLFPTAECIVCSKSDNPTKKCRISDILSVRPIMYVCVPSQTQGVQWYGGSPSHCSCLASAFHAPRRCASATSW